MLKFLGNKLFGAKKQENNKPKHRLTVSIPSTKYDPPSTKRYNHNNNHHHQHHHHHISPSSPSYSTHSTRSSPGHRRTKSSKKYNKPKQIHTKHQKTKSNLPPNIQTINSTKLKNGGIKAQSSSALNSPFKPPPIDTTRPIFQKSNIFHANSSLKVNKIHIIFIILTHK